MINFNKTAVSLQNETSTHRAIEKRRPKVRLTKQNKQFLQSLGILK